MHQNIGPSWSAQSDIRKRPVDDLAQAVRVTDKLNFDGRSMFNQYKRGPCIGKGQHGDVYVCFDTTNNCQVAVKIMKRRNPRAEKMKALRRHNPHSPSRSPWAQLDTTEKKILKEIAIMKKCRHAHIVRLLEVIDDHENEKTYMVMEYLAGGEVKWKNSDGEPILLVNQSRRICRDVILGLEYLHHQGIIHRDIKPANLLWTENRTSVKITDFGVSHFSYAQRLAAVGQSHTTILDPDDYLLLDESDLTKTAGTPLFLAPEVIAEPNLGPPASCSQPRRPAITKSIDVWSLGVTLFCLLFGHTPFNPPDDGNDNPLHREYQIYPVIRNEDWEPDSVMGYDRIPTGGRRPKGKHEGAVVMNVLDMMLQKNASDRITIEYLKRHSWFVCDIPNVEQWLRETSPRNQDPVTVTESDTSSAMSPLRFSWNWSKRLVSNIFQGRNPRRPKRDEEDLIGVTSAPHATIGRHKSANAKLLESGSLREKTKKDVSRPKTAHADTSTSLSGRSKSIEKWPPSRNRTRSVSSSTAKARRGSETLLVPPQSPRVSSSQTSPTSTSSRSRDELSPVDKQSLRTRFSFRKYLRKKPSQGPSPQPSAVAVFSAPPSRHASSFRGPQLDEPLTRRSDEGLGCRDKPHLSNINRPLTSGRRTSSWGDEYPEEVRSLHSGEQEIIDDETMFLGAGGVSNDPPPSPNASQSSWSDILGGPSVTARRSQLEHLQTGGRAAQASEPSSHDAIRYAQIRSSATSPLSRELYVSERQSEDDDYDDDSSLSYERDEDREPAAVNTSLLYAEEDEDEDFDESSIRHLEIRRRRPSVSITSASPPSRSPGSDDYD